MVDGLTRIGAFIKLVVPISLSGILTVVIFTFTLVTQEFVYALTFISPESNQMVGVGIPIFLVRGDVYFWGSLMAACLIASLPIAFLYNLFLDRFIAGFTVGAVKFARHKVFGALPCLQLVTVWPRGKKCVNAVSKSYKDSS
jgi:multiple sugar transport system permease protein